MKKYLIRYSFHYRKEARILCSLLEVIDIKTDKEDVELTNEKIFQIIEIGNGLNRDRVYSVDEAEIFLTDLMKEIDQHILVLRAIASKL